MIINPFFYIITIYYFIPCEFFALELAGSLSLESESPQDSFQYSGRSQQYFSLKGFDSSDFQFFQSLFQAFRNCSKLTNYSWYLFYRHVPQLFFSSPTRSKYLFICSLSFSLCGPLQLQNPLYDISIIIIFNP